MYSIPLDPLLLQSCGACLPTPNAMATFLATMSYDYRAYTFQGQGYVSPSVRIPIMKRSKSISVSRPSTAGF